MPRKSSPAVNPIDLLEESQRLAKETKFNYLLRIRKFLVHIGKTPEEFLATVQRNPKSFERDFVEYLKKRTGDVSSSTVWIDRDALKKLLELNRVQGIDWNYINEYLPRHKKFGSDRAPTLEEVRKIVEVADLRMKCLVLFLVSSGARIGSVAWLRWRDIEEVESDGKKFARVTIYKGEPEEYATFITPECLGHLSEYKRIRENLGEKVTPQSFVFVTEANKREPNPSKIRQVSVRTLKNQLGGMLKTLNMRTSPEGKGRYKNYEFKQAHGFRKFFKTRMEMAGAKPVITELLMGHVVGVSSSYMKPSTEELTREYAGVIHALTVLQRESRVDVKSELKTQLLLVAGFREEEIRQLDLSKTTDEDFQKMVRERLLGAMANNGNHQKVVPLTEVESYINQGWEWVAPFSNERAILRLPH